MGVAMTSVPAAQNDSNKPAVLREDIDAVAVLLLNRPSTLNALSQAMLGALNDVFAAIARDRRVKAVVLGAEGAVFCGGHDLKQIAARRSDVDNGRDCFTQLTQACNALMQTIVRLPQPVVAAVQGLANATGCQLVASCDLAVASSTASFCTPGVDIGLFCSTPMVALSRNISSKHAMEMLLTGEAVTAEHAQRIGLVNRVVPPGTERDEAIRLAGLIASKSAMAVRVGKAAFYRQRDMVLADAYQLASRVTVDNLLRDDVAEGIDAFLDNRMPAWRDR